MTSYLVAGPAIEPVSLEEAMEYCQAKPLPGNADLMNTLITSARIHIESTAALCLMNQTWQYVLNQGEAPETITLPLRPMNQVIKVAATYEPIIEIGVAGRMIVAKTPLIVTYVAGFGDARGDVPVDLRQAILYLCNDWYHNLDERGMVRNIAVKDTIKKWREK